MILETPKVLKLIRTGNSTVNNSPSSTPCRTWTVLWGDWIISLWVYTSLLPCWSSRLLWFVYSLHSSSVRDSWYVVSLHRKLSLLLWWLEPELLSLVSFNTHMCRRTPGYSWFLTLRHGVLGLSWLIGASLQEVLTSIIFLFIKHPFDVGDRINLEKTSYTVKEIRLLSTVLLDSTGTVVQAPNMGLNSMVSNSVIFPLPFEITRCIVHSKYTPESSGMGYR